MEEMIYRIIAIIGLILIISGTLLISAKKKRVKRRYIYPLLIAGGICLEIYSIYIQDLIFIILQAVFIVTSIYGLIKYHEHKHK